MKKANVLDAINDMPNDFDLEMLIEKLVFIEKVEAGLNQLENGKNTSHEDVKELVKKW
jgi:predicted transcriptional regulator